MKKKMEMKDAIELIQKQNAAVIKFMKFTLETKLPVTNEITIPLDASNGELLERLTGKKPSAFEKVQATFGVFTHLS